MSKNLSHSWRNAPRQPIVKWILSETGPILQEQSYFKNQRVDPSSALKPGINDTSYIASEKVNLNRVEICDWTIIYCVHCDYKPLSNFSLKAPKYNKIRITRIIPCIDNSEENWGWIRLAYSSSKLFCGNKF